MFCRQHPLLLLVARLTPHSTAHGGTRCYSRCSAHTVPSLLGSHRHLAARLTPSPRCSAHTVHGSTRCFSRCSAHTVTSLLGSHATPLRTVCPGLRFACTVVPSSCGGERRSPCVLISSDPCFTDSATPASVRLSLPNRRMQYSVRLYTALSRVIFRALLSASSQSGCCSALRSGRALYAVIFPLCG